MKPQTLPSAGEAVKSSGLLQAIAEEIQELTSGYDLFQVRHQHRDRHLDSGQ